MGTKKKPNKFELDEFFNEAAYFPGLEDSRNVPAVRNQLLGDNCYGYAVTSALFGDVKKKAGKTLLGSVDQLKYELPRQYPPRGFPPKGATPKEINALIEKGLPSSLDNAFKFIQKNGLLLKTHYQPPNHSSKKRKRKDDTEETLKRITIEDYEFVTLPSADKHQTYVIEALEKQPLVASIVVTEAFRGWHSDGIYSHPEGEVNPSDNETESDGDPEGESPSDNETQSDSSESESEGAKNSAHAVTIFGYGIEDERPYYIIQNSWGKNWGHKGYAKVSPNVIENIFYPIGTDYKFFVPTGIDYKF